MDLFLDSEGLVVWLKQFGLWAIVVSLLLNIIISILGIIPSLFLSGANAVIFGMIPGFLISLLGEVIGAGISFFLYRWGIHQIKSIRINKWRWLQQLDSISQGRRMTTLFIARLTPFIPSGVITFAASVSKMRFMEFIIITFFGKAPSIALETIVGHDLFFLNDNLPRLIISLSMVIIILLIFRKKKN